MQANISQEVNPDRRINHLGNIGSDYTRDIIQIVNYVFICSAVSVFGIVTNIINLIAFYKQGLDSTINISFFALAISDLCSLIMQLYYNIFVNPWLDNVGVPGSTTGIQFIVAGVPREYFARITYLITAFVAAERCLCIAFPLHVKQMITPKRTVLTMTSIYILEVLTFFPLYCTTYLDYKLHPATNTTLLGLAFRGPSVQVEGVVLFIHAISGILCFLAVVLFTIILIKKMSQKSAWRKSVSANCDNNESVSSRDRKTMTIVISIAAIVIICYTPSVCLSLVTFAEPEFTVGGKYSNLYISGWSFAFVFECINSSVNIFLYYSMSTRYRTAVNELLFTSTKSSGDNT